MVQNPAASASPVLVHGTCIALGPYAALLRGPSGSGKSDLALRFLALAPEEVGPAKLVADDQVCLAHSGTSLQVSPPGKLKGLIEVRGLGIQPVPFIASARLVVVCDLVRAEDVPRMPPDPWDHTDLAGAKIPALKIAPFEASAPLKLKMAIIAATAHLREAKQ
ncbi:MAG: HPr kinase/phosphatase C-terminal domain-containing protein [Pseudomonadota bacterium]